jgi:DNA-binding NarL/FixJ family response regulator
VVSILERIIEAIFKLRGGIMGELRSKKLSDIQKKDIKRMIEDGFTYSAIGRKLGICASTVRIHANKMGLKSAFLVDRDKYEARFL